MRAAAEAEDEEEDDADDEDEDEDDEDEEETDAEDDAGAVVAAADEDDDMDADEEETEEEDDDDEDEEEDAAVRAASWCRNCRNTAVLTCSPASTSKLGPNTFFHSAICPLRAWARACSSIACSNLDLAASTAVPSMATRAGHR